jgi:hypothetical protein
MRLIAEIFAFYKESPIAISSKSSSIFSLPLFPLISNRQLIYNITGCLFVAGHWFLLDKAFIILIALIIGQVLIVNYSKNDFDKRDELMKEAGNLTTNLQAIMEKMKGEKGQEEGRVKDNKEQLGKDVK